MFDLIIKNGMIIDGTGSPALRADVAVKDGKIVRVARGLTGAERVIDASGLTVTPGFIDSHSHSDASILDNPNQGEKIEQGITTSIGGQCGSSPAPSVRKDGSLRTMSAFLDEAVKTPQASNIAVLTGHGALRRAVMGMENRAPTADELEQMKALLRDALEHGSLGISFGLIYPPSSYAQTDELIALAKVAGEYHAIVAAHIRNESETLAKAAAEFITVLRESGTRGVLSHHKAAGQENWGKISHTLRMIDEANAEGIEVYCDVYPYIASHTSMAARFIPQELHALGVQKVLADPAKRAEIKAGLVSRFPDNLNWTLVVKSDAFPQYEGLRVPEIADRHGTDVYDAVLDIIAGGAANACYFTMCEEDVETVMAHPRVMIGTDSGLSGGRTTYHPRLRATFPRVLGRYVRERGVTTLPEMIRKMTSMPAAVYGLSAKGLIREGFDADICIFDADKIIDRATFTACTAGADGLACVLVNGQIVAENAVFNGEMLGKVLVR